MRRLYWPAIILGWAVSIALIIWAFPVYSQDAYVWRDARTGMSSTITLQPTEVPGAVAEVEFVNAAIHARDEDLTIPLTGVGLTVSVTAKVGRGATPDRIEVDVPPGYFAVPVWIDVIEGGTGVIVIYSGEMVVG